ncbi:XRE family transcriptional regulator [Streptomyces sp. NPDC059785]|uniref:nSTAND1 domain-containing NTPase n=1 Tax=Streptomyces sp. NPDC059785 TaxID=3346945 RepID=UPI00365FC9ED
MPRSERPLDADGPLAEFAAELRQLRRKAGNPPYRQLSERAHYSISTLSSAASGQRLPTLAVTLAYVQACDGRVPEWERRWRALAEQLGEAGAGAGAGTGPEPGPEEPGLPPPYAGLRPFREQDAQWFFGREESVDELAGRLARQRFVMVIGASGSGKSSLLRAGLVPRLRAAVAPVVVLTPGLRPLEECAVRLGGLAGVTPGGLYEELLDDPENLGRVMRQIVSRSGNGRSDDSADNSGDDDMVLVVDQFEEIFTLCRDDGERSRFVEALVTAASAEGSRCRVVLGVRADFYAHCTRDALLVEAMRDAQVPVGPMNPEQLRRAVVEPARRAGLTVEGALLATLSAQAHGRVGVLPLLSHALLETWRRRRGNALTLAGFEAAGGLEGALARTAEEFYQGLDAEQRELARRMFVRLTVLGEGTEDTRRPTRRTELDGLVDTRTETEGTGRVGDSGSNGENSGDIDAVLDLAADARLLTLDHERVELTHEALIRCWPRLHDWLSEDRETLRTLRRLTEAAQAWQELGRDPGALYRGAHLALATGLARGTLSTKEREFLDASAAAHATEDKAAQRRARVQRRLLTALVFLLAAALTAGTVAYDQRSAALNQRRTALSRAMAAQSAAVAAGQPEASMMLAVQAFHTARIPEARSALLSTQAQYFDGRLRGHRGSVNAVAFRPGGRELATAGADRTVILWDMARRSKVAVLRGHTAEVLAIAFSPDGRRLAVGTADRMVRIWDVDRRRSVSVFPGRARDLAFSTDGRLLAYGGSDDVVTLWDVARGRAAGVLRGHTDAVNSVAFTPDGSTLVSGSEDGTIRLWDLAGRRTLAVLRGRDDAVRSVAVSPDGEVAADAGPDGHIRLWDLRRRRTLAVLRGHSDEANALAFSRDGSALASAGGEGATRLWSVADHRLITSLPGHTDYVMDVAFSGRDNVLASTGFDGTTVLWDLDRPALITRPVSEISSIALSPDRQTLATGGNDGKVGLWDLRRRRAVGTLTGHTSAVASLAFSPDGETLAAGGNDGKVGLWDLRRRRAVGTLTGHTSAVGSLAFSPDGKTLATASNDWTVRLWDPARRKTLATLTRHSDFVNALAFSPDGRRLATASDDRTVRVWDPARHRLVATLSGHTGAVRSVAFSPDGGTLATASNDGTARLWDPARHRLVATLSGHTGAVRSVAFSPDGGTLATASNDGTARLWDPARHLLRTTLTGHTGAVPAVAYVGGETVLTAGYDGTVRLWDLDTDHRVRRVCRAVGALAPTQWRRLGFDIRDRSACEHN